MVEDTNRDKSSLLNLLCITGLNGISSCCYLLLNVFPGLGSQARDTDVKLCPLISSLWTNDCTGI